jgi:hypothetical protein
VSDAQVRKLMEEFTKHGEIGRAAMRADMDRKTARKYIAAGKLPSELKAPRTWRTREDPFDEHWPEVQKRLEEEPALEAKTLFDALVELHPGRYVEGQLRTLQRRVWLRRTTTNRGVGVVSYTGAEIRRAPLIGDPIDFFVPLEVSAAGASFQVVAVWTAATADKKTMYRQAHEGLDRYAAWIRQQDTVLMGDFNNNATYSKGKPWRELEERLRPLGLVSAYHEHFGEAFGQETRPTHYYRRKQDSRWHVDYCFLPASWIPRIQGVEVGTFEDWSGVSDHVPLIVDVSPGG